MYCITDQHSKQKSLDSLYDLIEFLNKTELPVMVTGKENIVPIVCKTYGDQDGNHKRS